MYLLFTFLLLSTQMIIEEGITLSGVVVSEDSVPFAEATVVLEAGKNGITRAVGTQQDGSFRIENIPVGSFTLWVAAERHALVRREIEIDSLGTIQNLTIKLHPDDSAQHWRVDAADRENFREATLLLADHKEEEALGKFQEFVIRYPYLVRTHYNIGLCHVELAAAQRDYNRGEAVEFHEESAQSHFKVVLERYPDFSPALVALAESHVRTLQMVEAETLYRRLLELNPVEEEQWYTYAEVLSYLKKLPEAVAAFERVLEIDPLYVDAHARIGAIMMTQGNYSEAARRFKLFLAATPNSNMAPLTEELLKEALSKVEAGKQLKDSQ